MAFIQSSLWPGLSSDTPRIVNFLSLNAWYAFTTFGFSARQGPHHDAQKSTSTYLPWNDDSLIVFPLVSAAANSGAICPTETLFIVVRKAWYLTPALLLRSAA